MRQLGARSAILKRLAKLPFLSHFFGVWLHFRQVLLRQAVGYTEGYERVGGHRNDGTGC